VTTIRPYGDTTDDGRVQVSFTLPVEAGPIGRAAALALADRMGLHPAFVAHMEELTPGYTFFIVYGAVLHAIDSDELRVEQREYALLSPQEVDQRVREVLKRRCVVLGACIETDAHTVGLDAILNIKGYAGDKGLEYYREFEIHNLGAQVSSEELVRLAQERRADALLVSQVVTQRDAHRQHLSHLVTNLVDAGIRDDVIVIAGGPRLQPSLAGELGLDAVFGAGTTPREVASYLAHALAVRVGTAP
jgi:beta-lysine 5,6-aminomutase beta subunit